MTGDGGMSDGLSITTACWRSRWNSDPCEVAATQPVDCRHAADCESVFDGVE